MQGQPGQFDLRPIDIFFVGCILMLFIANGYMYNQVNESIEVDFKLLELINKHGEIVEKMVNTMEQS